jgi:hypothetical protein
VGTASLAKGMSGKSTAAIDSTCFLNKAGIDDMDHFSKELSNGVGRW